MILQALEYETGKPIFLHIGLFGNNDWWEPSDIWLSAEQGKDLEEFFQSTAGMFSSALLNVLKSFFNKLRDWCWKLPQFIVNTILVGYRIF